MHQIVCPECGGWMEDIDQFGFDGIQCDTCSLVIRPDGTYNYSETDEDNVTGKGQR